MVAGVVPREVLDSKVPGLVMARRAKRGGVTNDVKQSRNAGSGAADGKVGSGAAGVLGGPVRVGMVQRNKIKKRNL